MFLNERQHLPPESRRRIGKWSRGLEQVFESVLKEGVRRGEFRSDLDTRLAVLGILGMANAVANWYRAEEVAIDHISGEFVRLLVAGVMKRPKPPRRRMKCVVAPAWCPDSEVRIIARHTHLRTSESNGH